MARLIKPSVLLFERCAIATLLGACLLVTMLAPSQAQPSDGEAHLLTISVCPPSHTQISIDVCHRTSERVETAISAALSISPDRTVSLVDSDARGPNVLRVIETYASELNSDDHLIIYLNAHGSTYSDWTKALVPDETIRPMVSGALPSETYTVQFWSGKPPILPMIALSDKSLIPINQIFSFLGTVDAKIALIIDSCFAELAHSALLEGSKPENLDLLVVASGAKQAANLTEDREASLYGTAIADAFLSAEGSTFGEVMELANLDAVDMATEVCRASTISRDVFEVIFPEEPIPENANGSDEVAMPDWYCIQKPKLFDFGGSTTALGV